MASAPMPEPFIALKARPNALRTITVSVGQRHSVSAWRSRMAR